jgi:hypothetical protein
MNTYASLPDFIRNASSAEKKKLYGDVLRRATERQQQVLDAYRAKQAEKNA